MACPMKSGAHCIESWQTKPCRICARVSTSPWAKNSYSSPLPHGRDPNHHGGDYLNVIKAEYQRKRNGVPTWHLYFLDSAGENHSSSFKALGRLYRDHLVIHDDPQPIIDQLRQQSVNDFCPEYQQLLDELRECTGGKKCTACCPQSKLLTCKLYQKAIRQAPQLATLALFKTASLKISEKTS